MLLKEKIDCAQHIIENTLDVVFMIHKNLNKTLCKSKTTLDTLQALHKGFLKQVYPRQAL